MDVLPHFFGSVESKPDASRRHILTHFLKDRTCSCPSCGYVQQKDSGAWPALPAGLKFDPSDEELIQHLLAKLLVGNWVPHPLLDDFIPTLEASEGICYTHPEKLPGISKDGSKRYFFHRDAKTYKDSNRKNRRIEDNCEYRWHKAGKARPLFIDGKQLGFKQILVLYSHFGNFGNKSDTHKTNWVIHQYHLGKDENEKDGELLVSKIFYQANNSRALSESAAKQAAVETCRSNTLVTTNSENSATEKAAAATYSFCSLGTTSFENNRKLCEVPDSDATSKIPIDSGDSQKSLKNETDDDAVFGGIEQNSSFVNKGCSLPNEGKDFTEWLQFYCGLESSSEFFHNLNSSVSL